MEMVAGGIAGGVSEADLSAGSNKASCRYGVERNHMSVEGGESQVGMDGNHIAIAYGGN